MKVLITGAAGKVGNTLVRELSEAGDEVVGFDAAHRPAHLQCRWFQGELTDSDALSAAMQGCDAVVHLAAVPLHIDGREVDTCRINIYGTVCVLDQAVKHGVSRVVAASSICAAGLITSVGAKRPSTLPITEEFEGGPDDMYGMSKRFGEYFAEAYERRHGLKMINLRIASVSFPDDEVYSNFMSTVFSTQSDSNDLLKDVRWQYVDVRDVTQAIRLALTKPNAHGVYNVGAGDTPGSDWTIWHRESFSQLQADALSPAMRNNPSAPIWSIDRIINDLGYAPKYGWRDYDTIREGAEGCRTRIEVRGARP